MPPAAATHQIIGETDRLNQVPHVKFDTPIVPDVPSEDGKIIIELIKSKLNDITRGGATLLSNVEGTDPQVGNATIVQQHADRNTSSRVTLLSMLKVGGNLYRVCNGAAFTTGRHVFDYLQGPNVIYLQPKDDVAEDHKTKIKALTYLDLPVDQQNNMLCLNLKMLLQDHNPKLHPNYNIPEPELIATYCRGLHSEAKLEANKCRQNIAHAIANTCCYPAAYPPHHPLAGAVHPNAGTLSLDLLAVYIDQHFQDKLNAGTFRLKGVPTSHGLNAVDEASANDDTADDGT